MAARRLAEGRACDGARPVRRRPRLLAALPASPGRRRVLCGAHDGAPRDARRPGRQGDDLPRPPEGRSPRRRRRRDRAREPQRRRAGARAAPRLASDRGLHFSFRSLAQLERKARGGWLRSPGTSHRPSAAARRGVRSGPSPPTTPRSPSTTTRSSAAWRRASRCRHAFARRLRDLRADDGRSSSRARRATARVPSPDRARGRRLRGGGLSARRDRRHRPRRAARARARAAARRAGGRARRTARRLARR